MTLDATTDDSYWDFSFENMADDVVASIKGAFDDNGNKGWYFGYSQGTLSAMIALTQYESEMAGYIYRAIFLAPCGAPYTDDDEVDLSEEAMSEVGFYRDLGVMAINGPNW